MRGLQHHKFAHFCRQEWTINGHQIKMIGYIKKPHTSIFTFQTPFGKTHLVLELIENHYKNHFDYIKE